MDGPLLAVVAEFFPHGAFEKWDDARDFGGHAVGRVVGLRDAHAVHDVHDDLAVGLRADERRDDFVHALHAVPAIGERAALFKERCAGQHDVRELRGLAHEDFLHDEEFQFCPCGGFVPASQRLIFPVMITTSDSPPASVCPLFKL